MEVDFFREIVFPDSAEAKYVFSATGKLQHRLYHQDNLAKNQRVVWDILDLVAPKNKPWHKQNFLLTFLC